MGSGEKEELRNRHDCGVKLGEQHQGGCDKELLYRSLKELIEVHNMGLAEIDDMLVELIKAVAVGLDLLVVHDKGNDQIQLDLGSRGAASVQGDADGVILPDDSSFLVSPSERIAFNIVPPGTSVPTAILTIEPQSISPHIGFQPMFSLRFPEGGSIDIDDGHFLITGVCEIVDVQGNVVTRFGREEG